jgi:DNA polymerase III delta prime subunit
VRESDKATAYKTKRKEKKMRYGITEQQEQQARERLGITRPNKPKEVAEYLADYEAYNAQVNNNPQIALRHYCTITQNRQHAQTLTDWLEKVEALACKVESYGETIALAVEAYTRAEKTYWDAIQAEVQRPRNEFLEAQRQYRDALEKETRSLKYKITRRRKEAFKLPQDSAERLRLLTEVEEFDNRITQIDFLFWVAGAVDFSEHPTFNDEAMMKTVKENEYRVNRFLTAFKEQMTANA